jgi:CSLREA domain-containing protein
MLFTRVRHICLLACLLLSLLLGASASSAMPAAEQPSAMAFQPGSMITLRASGIDQHTRVAPARRAPNAVQAATFSVNYLGGWTGPAQTAFQYAVNLWSSQIYSPVPIVIDATWAPLGTGVLGSAGATTSIRDFTNAPVSGTWYQVALANALAGYDLAPTSTDITANFSSNFANWYFGTDGLTPAGQYDFVSVVLHEIGHGLGFAGSGTVSSGSGTWGSGGFPYIYDRFTENGAGTDTITFTTPSTALATHLQSNDLYFNGTNANSGNGGTRPRLYAPATWEQGSSYSHLNESTYTAGNANSLMTPQIGTAEAIHSPGAVTMGIFRDLGWPLTGSPGQTEPNFLVNVLGDAPTDAGCTVANCTLREAVLAANANSNASEITFSVTGIIVLTQGQLTVSSPVTLTRPAGGITVSGNNASRIATVNSGATLTLAGVNLTAGKAAGANGGAILNSGTVSINQSTISNSTAASGGAILNLAGTVAIQQSTLSGNSATSTGGGIYNNSGASMTLSLSTLSGNTATTNGGGIYTVGGTASVSQSTLSGNSAATGGGFYNATGNTATIQQSTFSGNTVTGSGGGIFNNATLTVLQSTITNNTANQGGGINLNSSTLTIGQSIVSANTAPVVADVALAGGTITTQGYNLIGTTNSAGSFAATGDATGVTNPQLGALQNNGGPTLTRLPAAGSPAIDAGPATSSFATDQRGFVRLAGTSVDKGAVEANAPTAVTLLAFSGDPTAAGVTLRWKTGQQDAASSYLVERQTADGWLVVGELLVSPSGSYALTDPEVSPAGRTYRLSARTTDGSYEILGEISVGGLLRLYLPLIGK